MGHPSIGFFSILWDKREPGAFPDVYLRDLNDQHQIAATLDKIGQTGVA
jgi:hypothetical protein